MKTRQTLRQQLAARYRKQGILARNFIVANVIAVIGSLGASFWVLLSHIQQ